VTDRARLRRGAHASIAGEAADEVIQALIAQFSDPYAFVRELIQNSLDAGARRIEVRMRWADGVLTVDVVDDGEGMDRACIEGYLLVKFRSSKEQDLTKIGKFGIGFVSLFAMRPFEVVVDTGRDGLWHRVVFAADTSWKLLELDDPFEGTAVRLSLRQPAAQAADTAAKIRDAAVKWCRFAEGDVVTSAEGVEDGWAPTPIEAPWGVDAPLSVRHEGDGVRVVAGPWPGANPEIGWYNRGLTLWEGDGPLPGVTFRADGRHIEHTLTRDNVVRDRHLDVVLAAARRLAEGPLADAVHAALLAAEGEALDTLLWSMYPAPAWSWREDAPLFPAVGRARVSLGELRGGLFARVRKEPVWCAGDDARLAGLVAATGVVVLAGRAAGPGPRLAAGILGRPARDVGGAWVGAERVEGDAGQQAVRAAVEARVGPTRLGRLGGAFAASLSADGAARRIDAGPGGTVFLGVDHPLLASLARLTPEVAGVLGAYAVEAALGEAQGVDVWMPELLDALGVPAVRA
jgi:hypothetical protein